MITRERYAAWCLRDPPRLGAVIVEPAAQPSGARRL
jgi:hypothetical protein